MENFIKHPLRFLPAIIIGTAILGGCHSNGYSSKRLDLSSLKLTKDLTIKATTKKALIGDMSGIAVDNDGNMYLADTKLQKIDIFSPAGNYLGSLGRKGKGPGEFIHLNPHIHIREDTLYAIRSNIEQINLFNIKTKTLIRAIKIPEIKEPKTESSSHKTSGSSNPLLHLISPRDAASLGSPSNLFPLPNGNLFVLFKKLYFRAPKKVKNPN